MGLTYEENELVFLEVSMANKYNLPLSSRRGPLRRCLVTSQWNVEGGLLHVVYGWFLLVLSTLVFVGIDGLTGWDLVRGSL